RCPERGSVRSPGGGYCSGRVPVKSGHTTKTLAVRFAANSAFRESAMRILIVAALVLVPSAAFGQNEAILRQTFEGKVVAVKIEMPATSRAVDVHPPRQRPVDFPELAQRIKDNSTALRIGQQVMVTKVVVKKNSHIEFQLGG